MSQSFSKDIETHTALREVGCSQSSQEAIETDSRGHRVSGSDAWTGMLTSTSIRAWLESDISQFQGSRAQESTEWAHARWNERSAIRDLPVAGLDDLYALVGVVGNDH